MREIRMIEQRLFNNNEKYRDYTVERLKRDHLARGLTILDIDFSTFKDGKVL